MRAQTRGVRRDRRNWGEGMNRKELWDTMPVGFRAERRGAGRG